MNSEQRCAGFTLIEGLVALALILAFAGAVAPLLSNARAILSGAERRVGAHILLRSLLDTPAARGDALRARTGETRGLRWRVAGEPVYVAALPRTERPRWVAVRVTATVAWGPGRSVSGETLRLAQPE